MSGTTLTPCGTRPIASRPWLPPTLSRSPKSDDCSPNWKRQQLPTLPSLVGRPGLNRDHRLGDFDADIRAVARNSPIYNRRRSCRGAPGGVINVVISSRPGGSPWGGRFRDGGEASSVGGVGPDWWRVS